MEVENKLKSLPSDTIRLLGSSQVITSVFSVVKELVENSLDADSLTIEIKLENYGLDKVEVRDNGCGIDQTAIQCVAKRHHTSKITCFSDLEQLCTYGFRGEAVGSLCAVADLCITSKTKTEDVGNSYRFDHHGNIISQQASHLGQGTTIVAANLFKNIPVRRQCYSTLKKKKEELKKVEDLLMSYAIIKPAARITLRNNKDLVWQKTGMSDTRCAMLSVLGRNVVIQLEEVTEDTQEGKIICLAFLPKADSETTVTSRCTNDRCFIAVNGRPVQLKDLEKCVKQHYCNEKKCEGRYPICYVHLTIPPAELDVNVDPNKTRVMLHEQSAVMKLITSVLERLYGPLNNNTLSNQSETTISADNTLNTSQTSVDSLGSSPEITSCNYKAATVGSRKFTTENLRHNIVPDHSSEGSKLNTVSSDCSGNSGHPSKTDQNITSPAKCKESEYKDTENEMENVSQVENKACFDILDDDFEDILKTQNKSSLNPSLNDTDVLLGDISLSGDLLELCKTVSTANGETKEKGSNFTNVLDHRKKAQENSIEFNKSMLSASERMFICQNDDDVTSDLSVDKGSEIGNGDVEDGLRWSKGLAEVSTNGRPLQPVQLLAGGSHVTKKRPLSPSLDVTVTPPAKKSVHIEMDQPKLYDVIGRSPADKCPLGFVAFSKEMRPKIVEDHPNVSYDEISHMVRGRWSRLSDDERQNYEICGAEQINDLKKRVATGKKLIQKLDRRIQPVKGTPTIKDQLLAASKKSDIPVRSVRVVCSLQKLRQVFSTGPRLTQTQRSQNTTMKLIGTLKFYNGWLCCHGNKVKVINPHRIEETLLYRQLLDSHVIPAVKLETPTGLKESSVGGTCLYKQLLDLIPSNKAQTYVYIEDPRLKANGIEIRCHLDQDSKPVLELVAMATCMPMYSVRDLQEILELILNSGADTLYKSRPLKVKFYLQSEAVRIIRQRPVHRSRHQVVDLLERMQELLPQDCSTCLHDKPLFHTVYDFDDVPSSQGTQT